MDEKEPVLGRVEECVRGHWRQKKCHVLDEGPEGQFSGWGGDRKEKSLKRCLETLSILGKSLDIMVTLIEVCLLVCSFIHSKEGFRDWIWMFEWIWGWGRGTKARESVKGPCKTREAMSVVMTRGMDGSEVGEMSTDLWYVFEADALGFCD